MSGRDGLTVLLEAFGSGDLTAAAACFAPDATYREARGAVVQGRDAIAVYFARFAASARPWAFEIDDVMRDGCSANVVYRFRMAGGASEPERERAGCAIVRFDESGQIVEWREYAG